MIHHQDVKIFLQDQGLEQKEFIPDDLEWICARLATATTQRELSQGMLDALAAQIRAIPTGRQRRLQVARDQVLLYLGTVCEWTLPPTEDHIFVDHAQQWMLAIQRHNCAAGILHRGYRQTRQQFLRSRRCSLGFLLTALMVEVAPLPLRYWQAVLASPDPLRCFEGGFTVEVPHPTALASYTSHTQPSITRLPLNAFAYRLLAEWLAQQDAAPTAAQMVRALNLTLEAAPYGLAHRSAAHWQRTALALWHHQHQVPVDLLRDIGDPMRHVATLQPITDESSRLVQGLVASPTGSTSQAESPTAAGAAKRRWPHLVLIRALRQGRAPDMPLPALIGEDLVPALLCRYVMDLVVHGGIKQPQLPPDTVARYTNFHQYLAPLSADQAADPEALAGWAHASLAALADTESQQWHFFQFLRSVAQQPLTDHLDLELFERPTLPARVDAWRLSTAQVHALVSALLDSQQGHALQRLFAALAALLGYYGALRRGEVLRLRVGDVRVMPDHPDRFELLITRTREGRTKNRKTRRVYPVLPEIAAKLLRVALKIHAGSEPQQPLLGFCGESIAARAAHYLLPVTQGLKAFSPQVRFHHLRHAGAELLVLQGLHLAYQRDGDHLAAVLNDPLLQGLLSPAACRARFDFWLEGREWAQVNEVILLDVISSQLGHSYYATTRRHYLHGLERIMPLFWPRTRAYCRDELRYVLGMAVGSNDISRVLAQLCPGYLALSDQAKKSFSPTLSEGSLFAKMVPKAVPTPLSGSVDPEEWLRRWLSNAPASWQQDAQCELLNGEVLRGLAGGRLDMATLSRAWQGLGQRGALILDAAQRRALRCLGLPEIVAQSNAPTEIDTLGLVFRCRCNQEHAQALTTLRQLPLLAGLPATLTLFQNRKTLKSDKFSWLQRELACRQDRVVRTIMAEGNSYLQIQFNTPLPAALLKAPLHDFFSSIIFYQPKQDVNYGQ